MATSSTIQVRSSVKKGVATIKCLVSHPMETGMRKDKKGKLIPAKFIQNLSCEHAGNVVLDAELNGSVSTNPYIKFKFSGATKGDTIKVSWVDNKGDKDSVEVEIPTKRRRK
ncbi:MAG: thiosulfate oxidation carrier complex protein SoxZ [Gammaproteobacteria bacterium]